MASFSDGHYIPFPILQITLLAYCCINSPLGHGLFLMNGLLSMHLMDSGSDTRVRTWIEQIGDRDFVNEATK
jgi:hypothetical protein